MAHGLLQAPLILRRAGWVKSKLACTGRAFGPFVKHYLHTSYLGDNFYAEIKLHGVSLKALLFLADGEFEMQ